MTLHLCTSSPSFQVIDESEMAGYRLKLEAWHKAEEEKKNSFSIVDVSTKSASKVWNINQLALDVL